MISALPCMCLVWLGASVAAALASGLDPRATWLAGIELLTPGLITGLAITLFLLRKSHNPWR